MPTNLFQEYEVENAELGRQLDEHAQRMRRAQALPLQPSKQLPSSLFKDIVECPVCLRSMQTPLQVRK